MIQTKYLGCKQKKEFSGAIASLIDWVTQKQAKI